MLSAIFSGIIVGSIPCACMLFASYLMMKVVVSNEIEAMLQNFSAGLILAAVGDELFPLISSVKGSNDALGITIGFIFGLSLVYGVESFVNTFEEGVENAIEEFGEKSSSTKEGTPDYYQMKRFAHGEYEIESVNNASDTMNEHKSKLKGLIKTIVDATSALETKALSLSHKNLSDEEVDIIAEEIDKEIHSLDYLLDQSRRLFEGSRSTKMSEDKQKQILTRLEEFKYVVRRIQQHLQSDTFDRVLIKEIYDEMNDAGMKLIDVHDSVEVGFSKWTRSRPFHPIEEGAHVPLGMLIPICVDGLCDGFLIGVSCALSFNAGIILASANSIEMSLLGAALSARVAKCTGSPVVIRYLSICMPPITMLLGTVIGAYLGDISKNDPIIFVAFVAFGVVALLYLVCNELLIEARELQDGKNSWKVSIFIFIGVFIVLVSDALS